MADSLLFCSEIIYLPVVQVSVATGPDDPDNPGQTGHILTGSLGYPDITKITGIIRFIIIVR